MMTSEFRKIVNCSPDESKLMYPRPYTIFSSLDEYEITSDDCKRPRFDCEKEQAATLKPIRPVRQNVVLVEDILYKPGRHGRPHK